MNAAAESGALVRKEFGAEQTALVGVESAASAVAAKAKAMVESRYIMAMRQPRNWDQVRSDILKECRRPSFASNKSALYRKPIGDGIEGLGIRFVEVAMRCMKNVLVESQMIFDDSRKEIHCVSVTDLEANLTYPLDIIVERTVERSKPESDGSYISVRKNSYGKLTYTVTATQDDILNKRNASISKAIRTLGLRIIPGDIQDEAEATIRQIREDKAAKDPDGERKSIVDAFAALNVRASDLAEYLGHDLGSCSPAELVNLRGFYGAIRDGETTWSAVVEAKVETKKPAKADAKGMRDDLKNGQKPKDPVKPGSVDSHENRNPGGQPKDFAAGDPLDPPLPSTEGTSAASSPSPAEGSADPATESAAAEGAGSISERVQRCMNADHIDLLRSQFIDELTGSALAEAKRMLKERAKELGV